MAVNDRATWKEWSGREQGDQNYHFGDFTRGFVRKIVFREDHMNARLSEASVEEPQGEGCEEVRCPSAQQDPMACAHEGLDNMQRGLSLFERLDMPHGQEALQTIAEGLQRLQQRVAEAEAYQRESNDDGSLLSVQVCFAAGEEEPPEWSMGQMYTSTNAIMFKSNEAPPWTIGPVKWNEIAQIQRLDDNGHHAPGSGGSDIRLTFKGGSYQFSGLSNVEWFGRFGHSFAEASPVAATNRGSMPPSADNEANLQLTEATDEALDAWLEQLRPDAAPLSPQGPSRQTSRWDMPPQESRGGLPPMEDISSFIDEADPQPAVEVTPLPCSQEAPTSTCDPIRGPSSMGFPRSSLKRKGTAKSFYCPKSFLVQAEELPDVAPPRSEEPNFITRLEKATLPGIRAALEANDNWPIVRYFEDVVKSFDVKATSWAPARRVPGTLMRRLRFQMPLPEDVPSAVKRLVSLPDTSLVTLLARVGSTDEKVVLVQEACSHDVTYGENFWAQDVLLFQPHPDGGVLFMKWTHIRWVVALPWYAAVLSTYIEMKAKEDSKNAGAHLAECLKDRC
mmetsp:Transcript_47626/g.92113  ORF Transcript_47626/g.92113 Transcript_47626/m.92113 type:complete len:562 (-) Transcript_47626:8-1693(-)